MEIILNGTATEVDDETTVLGLLESREIDPKVVVVERNGEIVSGDAFAATQLSDGDHLEVLRFVGGG